MLVRALFFAFIALALLGDARIFLFVLNRFVFGDHQEEKNPWHWLMFVTPPVLPRTDRAVLAARDWIDGSWRRRSSSV